MICPCILFTCLSQFSAPSAASYVGDAHTAVIPTARCGGNKTSFKLVATAQGTGWRVFPQSLKLIQVSTSATLAAAKEVYLTGELPEASASNIHASFMQMCTDLFETPIKKFSSFLESSADIHSLKHI